MIFRPPEIKKGTLSREAFPRRGPATMGDREDPVVRAMPVIPAAAERSSGLTTAMVYDWRVGTSIWEMLKRISKTVMASGKLGMRGTRINRILEGMCVKTIVLISPILEATLAAARAEMPASTLAPKKIVP